nr:hypothetical protein CFP56_36988 [Quercus suber]
MNLHEHFHGKNRAVVHSDVNKDTNSLFPEFCSKLLDVILGGLHRQEVHLGVSLSAFHYVPSPPKPLNDGFSSSASHLTSFPDVSFMRTETHVFVYM